MLNIDFSEVPTKREANIGQWLALRNLGLVPVASPESFEWPGADQRRAQVMHSGALWLAREGLALSRVSPALEL